ncbi:Protein CBG07837 [Caenorhabditis briggsae]|uniref:Protein CBG07837 n=2 Tax=Caenorhabditis briggsae TaxID=6238 RepID=A8X589_CAEBR|nr:Protein CBG07837 [Caenorhabditis briggsae]ULU08233.1 hypothetical protein L3Y34_019396 [Caenorhabditis briggsae]CAP27788.1 Protein CBG07837 [Caenorhabditis briggsae]
MNYTHIPEVISLYRLEYAIHWAVKNSKRREPSIPGVQKKYPSPWVQFYMSPGMGAPIKPPKSSAEDVEALISSMLPLFKKLIPLAPESARKSALETIAQICAQNRDAREGLDTTEATTESFQPDLLPADLLISRDVAVVLDGMLDDVEKLEMEPDPEPIAFEMVRTMDVYIGGVADVEYLQKPLELKATTTTSSQTVPQPSDLLIQKDVAVVLDRIVEELEKEEREATTGTQTEVLHIDPLTQKDVAVVLDNILEELEKQEDHRDATVSISPSNLLFQRDVVVVLENILDEIEKRELGPEPQPIGFEVVRTTPIYIRSAVSLVLQSPQVATWARGCQATPVLQGAMDDVDNMPSSSSKVPELQRKLQQVRRMEQTKKRKVLQQTPLAPGSPEFQFKWNEAMAHYEKCSIYKDPYFDNLKNLFDPEKNMELPQKVPMRSVSAADLFNAFKKAYHFKGSWRDQDAAEKEKWDGRKEQLLKEFLCQLEKGFIYTREDGEPAAKASKAANGEKAE